MPRLNRVPGLGYLDWNFPTPIYPLTDEQRSYCLHLCLQLDNIPPTECRPWESISFVNGEPTAPTGLFPYTGHAVSSEDDLQYIPHVLALAAKCLSRTKEFREVRIGNSDIPGLINIQIVVRPSANETVAFVRQPTGLLASLSRKMAKAIK
jgi:hypothetical protein